MSNELHTIEDQSALAKDLGGGIWSVPSASIPDHSWMFNANTNFCECPGYEMAKSRGHLCRHGRAVEMRRNPPPPPEPLIVTLERSIEAVKKRKRKSKADFLRAAQQAALAADLAADPDAEEKPRGCSWCNHPEKIGQMRHREQFCAPHKKLWGIYRQHEGVRLIPAAMGLTGFEPDSVKELRQRITQIGARLARVTGLPCPADCLVCWDPFERKARESAREAA